jgi:hypothetical protein
MWFVAFNLNAPTTSCSAFALRPFSRRTITVQQVFVAIDQPLNEYQ